MLSPLDNRDTSAHQHRVPIKSVHSKAEFAEHLFNLNPTCIISQTLIPAAI